MARRRAIPASRPVHRRDLGLSGHPPKLLSGRAEQRCRSDAEDQASAWDEARTELLEGWKTERTDSQLDQSLSGLSLDQNPASSEIKVEEDTASRAAPESVSSSGAGRLAKLTGLDRASETALTKQHQELRDSMFLPRPSQRTAPWT